MLEPTNAGESSSDGRFVYAPNKPGGRLTAALRRASQRTLIPACDRVTDAVVGTNVKVVATIRALHPLALQALRIDEAQLAAAHVLGHG